jgi:hypothetical protein
MDAPAGFHVTNPYFAALLHGVHSVLDPVCAATAGYDAAHGWAPCTAAKLLLLVAAHLAAFALLRQLRSARPAPPKKSVIELANECLQPAAQAAGASSATRAPNASGLRQR